MKFAERKKRDPIINVINMVDVFLTLLIFFMMTTTFASNSGIKIRLPKSGLQSSAASKKPITIYITKLGNVYYKKKKITLKKLSEILSFFKKSGANPTIVIKADKASKVSSVVAVMSSAIKNGLYKIAIATKK
ncbi:MAG: biopolymer transporter ExbD [Candidatus Acididesulfobacter guangdongensis]|jgi:biopolymer transport protein ExbD|uniref:Biopolymer transporter ExbD n=1 Tax=Acididesulfobacter guangdongensis TaxID=2597225 RepID=A0A519BEV5_ACIG2|nr:MAG: biopolymer transporter ExbD [Candidatus Acididesulfobacter guangdongensis]